MYLRQILKQNQASYQMFCSVHVEWHGPHVGGYYPAEKGFTVSFGVHIVRLSVLSTNTESK